MPLLPVIAGAAAEARSELVREYACRCEERRHGRDRRHAAGLTADGTASPRVAGVVTLHERQLRSASRSTAPSPKSLLWREEQKLATAERR